MHNPTSKEKSEYIICKNLRDLNAKFNQVWISAGGKLFAIIIQFSRPLMKIGLHEIHCIVVHGTGLKWKAGKYIIKQKLCHKINENALYKLKQVKHKW